MCSGEQASGLGRETGAAECWTACLRDSVAAAAAAAAASAASFVVAAAESSAQDASEIRPFPYHHPWHSSVACSSEARQMLEHQLRKDYSDIPSGS